VSAAAALVDAKLGVNQPAVLLQQKLRAVEVAALLVGRQRDDEVALGPEVLLPVADEVGDEDGGHRLVVAGAAAVEVAFALGELEGVETLRPVLPAGLDHVDVGEQKERLARARAAQARDEIPLALVAGGD
jgi:hypothetical protein